jgi:hypothetical protein
MDTPLPLSGVHPACRAKRQQGELALEGKHKDSTSRQTRYEATRRASGWKRCSLWVPPEHIQHVEAVLSGLKILWTKPVE